MVIADSHQFKVWSGTPPGIYQIALGMYDPVTMRDLEPQTGESLILGTIEVQRGLASGAPEPQFSLNANLGNQVQLVGYDLPNQGQPGTSVRLTLFWQALAQPENDYTVFVHVVDPEGNIRAQADSQPVTGYYPTGQWTAGEFVRDQHDLALPEDLPPGEYQLLVGMYQAGTGDRLPLLDRDGAISGDTVEAGSIQVGEP
jgi:hypothetical protein